MMRCDLCEAYVPDGVSLCIVHRQHYSQMRNELMLHYIKREPLPSTPDERTKVVGRALTMARLIMQTVLEQDVADAEKDGRK